MAADAIELLDRQYERLASAVDSDFIRESIRFHEFITERCPPVVAVLAELRQEAADAEARFRAHDEVLVPELVALCDELVALAPAADDSQSTRPTDPLVSSMRWTFTLANFDQLASLGPNRNVLRDGWDDSRSGTMLRILENKLRSLQWYTDPDGPNPQPSETNLRPDLDDLGRRLSNIGERHQHAARAYAHLVETHGGVQVVHLDVTVRETNPEPVEIVTDEDRLAAMNRALHEVSGGWHTIQRVMAGRDLSDQDRRAVELHVERIRPAAERVYEDVRLRLATAPEPPPPVPGYWQRLMSWARSPDYALVGGPSIGGVVAAISDGADSWPWFMLAAVVLAVVPPAVPHLASVQLTYTRVAVTFIALVTGVVVVLMLTVGFWASVGTFVGLIAAFTLGRFARS
jgi:hypothetical protein